MILTAVLNSIEIHFIHMVANLEISFIIIFKSDKFYKNQKSI